MSNAPSDIDPKIADAQRRALFAAEVIVNRKLHDFSALHNSHYSNDVAAVRKSIEKEIVAIRRRVPIAPFVSDDLVGAVAEAAAVDADTVRRTLLALAGVRPDVLSSEEFQPEPDDDDDDE